ncbi:MAG: hypothetical protein MJ247_06335 [Alphaproteobacteria bacterium]|nr:hypothetical protein [Alphaproteobacteria bacterium]
MTKNELIDLLRLGVQIDEEKQKNSAFITKDDLASWDYVINTLFPLIKDYRTRKIVWLRLKGTPWKNISSEAKVSERRSYGLFQEGINLIHKSLNL